MTLLTYDENLHKSLYLENNSKIHRITIDINSNIVIKFDISPDKSIYNTLIEYFDDNNIVKCSNNSIIFKNSEKLFYKIVELLAVFQLSNSVILAIYNKKPYSLEFNFKILSKSSIKKICSFGLTYDKTKDIFLFKQKDTIPMVMLRNFLNNENLVTYIEKITKNNIEYCYNNVTNEMIIKTLD